MIKSIPHTDDLTIVIRALSKTRAALNGQIARISDTCAALEMKRAETILLAVHHYLPAISPSVLSALRLSHPDFVDAVVEHEFNVGMKAFGLFKRAGYSERLELMRARLTNYLCVARLPDVLAFDSEIMEMNASESALAKQRSAVTDTLALLDHCQIDGTPLSDAAHIDLQRLAFDAIQITEAFDHLEGCPLSPERIASEQSAWRLYYLSVPGSFRAAMMDKASRDAQRENA